MDTTFIALLYIAALVTLYFFGKVNLKAFDAFLNTYSNVRDSNQHHCSYKRGNARSSCSAGIRDFFSRKSSDGFQ